MGNFSSWVECYVNTRNTFLKKSGNRFFLWFLIHQTTVSSIILTWSGTTLLLHFCLMLNNRLSNLAHHQPPNTPPLLLEQWHQSTTAPAVATDQPKCHAVKCQCIGQDYTKSLITCVRYVCCDSFSFLTTNTRMQIFCCCILMPFSAFVHLLQWVWHMPLVQPNLADIFNEKQNPVKRGSAARW